MCCLSVCIIFVSECVCVCVCLFLDPYKYAPGVNRSRRVRGEFIQHKKFVYLVQLDMR